MSEIKNEEFNVGDVFVSNVNGERLTVTGIDIKSNIAYVIFTDSKGRRFEAPFMTAQRLLIEKV